MFTLVGCGGLEILIFPAEYLANIGQGGIKCQCGLLADPITPRG